MKTLTINEAESNFSSVLTEIEEKKEIFIICRNGKPVADLIPHSRKTRRLPHPVMSAVRINYDPTEILSQDEWPEDDDQ
ncbi:MAG: type II toxin-antitoxin system Phd/YefM family antitoxin [Candidatus Cloacimonadota bacterium]|nr:type II toxin-antitoxin system Phd/YefM family antitoxin [Candidatus Cloacimonadota bacterium]